MASFYANENFPIGVVHYLREMGHEVLTSQEAGNANQRIPDEDVLAFAAKAGRILLTLNRRDFIELHEKAPNHAGIVVCTQNTDLREQSEQIDEAVRETGTAEQTFILGSPTDIWNRTWTPEQLSNTNFRVRVVNVSGATSTDFSLDWIAVRVTYK